MGIRRSALEDLVNERMAPSCRSCAAPLTEIFADLGMAPSANAYVAPDQFSSMEPFFPLCAYVCSACFLVQIEQYETPDEMFSDYAYFSSYSSTWLEHARRYVSMIIERLDLGPESMVVEIASNDGYLLQNFLDPGIPVLGVEPASNVAAAAEAKGIPSLVRFFGLETARELRTSHAADLLIGNNVLAHVPDLNDFVAGLAELLAPRGVITMEFPHLMRLVDEVQFDTIYHEHFSYFSFSTVRRVFARHGLALFDVEELPTHGGSLRIYACHSEDESKPTSPSVEALAAREDEAGYNRIDTYRQFAERVKQTKRSILSFFVAAKERGATIAGYGAPAKGNTLLNYCGIGTDFIDFTVDRNPHKQGHLLPGTRIPILDPAAIGERRPDYLFILPWNLREEIMEQMAEVRAWGCRFVVPSPELRVYE
jgi:SAM-dependent methyltransferase